MSDNELQIINSSGSMHKFENTIYMRRNIDNIMPQKPDGSIFFIAKNQTVAFNFGNTGKVFMTNKKAWEYFIKRHCVEVSDTAVKGGNRYPQSGGTDPLEPGIPESEMLRRLFR